MNSSRGQGRWAVLAALVWLPVAGAAAQEPPAPAVEGASDGNDSLAMLAGPGYDSLFGPPAGRYPPAYRDRWGLRLLPEGLIYRSYLAGMREPRFASVWFNEEQVGSLWDVALGGRAGILRFGDRNDSHPRGWQLDIEGAAFPRLDLNQGRREVVSTDFRFGVPLTLGLGCYQMKLAYYHLSSHLSDEFIERKPQVPRKNYVRDAFVWGHSWYFNTSLRGYAEVGYAYHTDGGSEPWEFQFGLEYAPVCPTGWGPVPFLAVNVDLREENGFGGAVSLQAGLAWRNTLGRLARLGLHYYNGKSPQAQFFDEFEQQLGFGLWFDY